MHEKYANHLLCGSRKQGEELGAEFGERGEAAEVFDFRLVHYFFAEQTELYGCVFPVLKEVYNRLCNSRRVVAAADDTRRTLEDFRKVGEVEFFCREGDNRVLCDVVLRADRCESLAEFGDVSNRNAREVYKENVWSPDESDRKHKG